MWLIPEPLAAAPFAAFGDVLEAPVAPGRSFFDGALANLRPGARPSLSSTRKQDLSCLPSSQSFVPIEAGRWLVVVAPHATTGGPDLGSERAFLAGRNKGSPMPPTSGIIHSRSLIGPHALPSTCGSKAARAMRNLHLASASETIAQP